MNVIAEGKMNTKLQIKVALAGSYQGIHGYKTHDYEYGRIQRAMVIMGYHTFGYIGNGEKEVS